MKPWKIYDFWSPIIVDTTLQWSHGFEAVENMNREPRKIVDIVL